jgi:hypothetical protein
MSRSRKLARAFASALLLAGSLVQAVACSVESEDDQEPVGVLSNELTSSKTVGDWHLFPNGEECLAAVQMFYPAKFHASLPLAGDAWKGNCAPHGACHIWLDRIPDPDVWERIPNDGHHLPTTYDVIVYPPISGDPWGHIASVDHVEGKTIYVIDDNYVAHHEKASHPHTVSWAPYGWYHLKKLGKTPAPPKSSAGDCVTGGLYCGGDKVSGSSSTLYRCEGSSISVVETCHHGCKVQSGKDDACGCVAGSRYCGGDVVQGDGSTLYECQADGVSTKIVSHCAHGCAVHAGNDDACK